MSGRPDVVLVRHGETEWSRSGRHTGRTDLPLTEHGEQEARAAGEALAGRSFALVLTSPLRRARDTVRLAGFGDAAQVWEDLREWDYGAYEGRSTDDIRQDVPGWLIWTDAVPGGETLAQVASRADRVIERIRGVDGDVAVFGHGHMLRILTARWCDLPAVEGRRFLLRTGTVSRLGWEHDYPAVQVLNDRGGPEPPPDGR